MKHLDTLINELTAGDLKIAVLNALIEHDERKKSVAVKKIKKIIGGAVTAGAITTVSAENFSIPRSRITEIEQVIAPPGSSLKPLSENKREPEVEVKSPEQKKLTQRIDNLINFASGSTSVTRSQLEKLDAFLKLLPAGAELEIIGHADATGTPENNMIVGKKRAKSVAKYLAAKGAKVIYTSSKGSDSLLVKESGSNFKNRRVEVIISKLSSKIEIPNFGVSKAYSRLETMKNRTPAKKNRHLARKKLVMKEETKGIEVEHYVPECGSLDISGMTKIGTNKDKENLFWDGKEKMIVCR